MSTEQVIPAQEAVVITITSKDGALTVDFNTEDELVVQNVIKGAFEFINEKLMFDRFLNRLKQMSAPQSENKIVIPKTSIPSDLLIKKDI